MARNEADTRADLIDPVLVAAGWGQVDGSRITREYVISLGRIKGAGQPQEKSTADYVLLYRNRKVAVIEAKAEAKPLTEGLAQAKRDARKLGIRFTYCSNGHGFYQVDLDTGKEGKIQSFPSPEELWERSFANSPEWSKTLIDVPFESQGGAFGGRYYQDTAVEKVIDSIAAGNKRILLTLATGTGKTFIAFQIAWKLFQSKWNLSGEPTRRPRILFLADRNILANQAYNAFSAFDEDALVRISPAQINKKGSVPTNGSVFFTIFQTFMSGTDADDNSVPNFGQYPPDFFDFIVVDECHRGGANSESEWRGILEHFSPAVQLGLTATPRREENVDTYDYFGDPVHVYSLKDGVEDGFLTPFRVVHIDDWPDEWQIGPDDLVIQGEIDDTKYVEGDFNTKIEIEEREKLRVECFMDDINQEEKTLVFCATQVHALLVRDLINQKKTIDNPNYCVRVTANEGEIGEQFLREFQDNEKSIPTILTTSRKLSTGVDALNIRNIVLMRPIKSMVEFKQIIGRGTRLFDGKEYFTVYDFVKAAEHFKDPEWDGEPEPGEPRPGVPRPEPSNGDKEPESRPEMIKVKLAPGREIEISMATTFWGPDGKQITAEEFLQLLFKKLPAFYKDQDELRKIWSDPLTRIELLTRLRDEGFGNPELEKIQELISAKNSDLYDVLAYISFAAPLKSRDDRASTAKKLVKGEFSDHQREFIDFVLDHYRKEGVGELIPERLSPLLELKYGGTYEGLNYLAVEPEEARKIFFGFQKYLYESTSADR